MNYYLTIGIKKILTNGGKTYSGLCENHKNSLLNESTIIEIYFFIYEVTQL
jgi:hypothetical protein